VIPCSFYPLAGIFGYLLFNSRFHL
jgi:hypothetical protein